MPRACSVCTHPKRGEIDGALTRGVPYRGVASQYGAGRSSVERHLRQCLRASLAKHGLDVSQIRESAKAVTVPSGAYESLLVQGAQDRAAMALGIAKDLTRFLAEVRSDAKDGGPEAWEAVAKLASAIVSALGGGVSKHEELRGKVTGEIPTGPKVVVQVNLGGVQVDATTDELRGLVARTSSFFAERHPELVDEFRAYLTEGA